MSRDFPESDWKVFRQLHRVALERFCQRALDELGRIAADNSNGAHERYLAVYRLVHQRNKEIARAFDAMRRSVALQQLALIQSHELLTEEELARFSPETRARVEGLLEIFRS